MVFPLFFPSALLVPGKHGSPLHVSKRLKVYPKPLLWLKEFWNSFDEVFKKKTRLWLQAQLQTPAIAFLLVDLVFPKLKSRATSLGSEAWSRREHDGGWGSRVTSTVDCLARSKRPKKPNKKIND